MLDTRVLKKMAVWLGYVLISMFFLLTALWIGHTVFDVGPDVVHNWILAIGGVYFFYQIAKFKVELERAEEQRLADKISKLEESQ
jgi:apolipoprotein N-acyltransferase